MTQCDLCGGPVDRGTLTADSHPAGPNHVVGECCADPGADQEDDE